MIAVTGMACPVCAATGATVVIEASGVDTARDRIYRVVRCTSCGFIYLDGRISAEDGRALDFREFHGSPAPLFAMASKLMSSVFTRQRVRTVERRAARGRLLDVGCGNGLFVKMMQRRGWRCTGLDESPYAIEAARDGAGASFVRGTPGESILDGQRFDLITFWHSLEHVPDLSAALDAAVRLLADGGSVFISVPNVESFEARIGLKAWLGLELPFHRSFFSSASLVAALARHGLEVTAMKKNSLEYNFAYFAQTFFNALGGEHNLLQKLVKRYERGLLNWSIRRIYTIVLMLMMMPVVLAAAIALYGVNLLTGNGPVIEVFARKRV